MAKRTLLVATPDLADIQPLMEEGIEAPPFFLQLLQYFTSLDVYAITGKFLWSNSMGVDKEPFGIGALRKYI